MNSIDVALICKALSDANRLQIVQMLSDGEKCGCKLLEQFDITQPTLSYHMKILIECGLVKSQKEGSWIRYSNNTELIENIKNYWNNITTEQENCICKNLKEESRCD